MRWQPMLMPSGPGARGDQDEMTTGIRRRILYRCADDPSMGGNGAFTGNVFVGSRPSLRRAAGREWIEGEAWFRLLRAPPFQVGAAKRVAGVRRSWRSVSATVQIICCFAAAEVVEWGDEIACVDAA